MVDFIFYLCFELFIIFVCFVLQYNFMELFEIDLICFILEVEIVDKVVH